MDDCVTIKPEPIDGEELEAKIRKIRDIIVREHEIEIDERESQVETIQERIQVTQTYMKVLKYVVSYGYYQQGDDPIPTEPGEPTLEQAIHPCVQKLLPSWKPEGRPNSEASKFEAFTQKKRTLSLNKVEEDRNITLVRGTYKVKHKLVIGNVSKWISPDVREGEASHKWMMYLRDIDRDKDLVTLIKKVRYFLHESYKPHDVIDVTSSPFHLTRRGWGEFPVRVKIFFQHPANKPIDFVHSLRLDDTCSGVQTLGGETVIDVDLFHENISDFLSQKESPKKEVLSKNEEIIALEHDYCAGKSEDSPQNEQKPQYQPQQIESHTPSTGLEVSEVAVLREWSPDKHCSIVDWYNDHVLNRASNIIFLNTEACVKWFLKRWPIVTHCAASSLYKQVHPYTFKCFSDFAESNIGKQRAAEWYRSAKIRRMLEQLNIRPWTTKEIMLYSRMYGYVIVNSKQYYSSSDCPLKDISSYTTNVDTSGDLRQLEHSVTSEEVDVVGEEDANSVVKSPVKCQDKVYIVNSWVKYVEDVSKELGAKFGEEEVIPGCLVNASTHVVVRAVKCFLNDLVRKSLANAWLRNSLKCPGSLEVTDILKTVLENPEFDILTNAGLGTKPSLSL